jgi:class 3 adenylate cyclase/uncharacterized protein HemY
MTDEPASCSIVTVLFADICAFTSRCRDLSPEASVTLANRYFERLASPVYEAGGSIDKYIGDALMAVFPGSIVRAAQAALEMRHEANRLGREAEAGLSVRIGLHTGLVARAPVGDSRFRPMTVMGDTVNLARRIESLAEPGTILVSTATRRALGDRMRFRSCGPATVKGFSVPVGLHELEGPGTGRGRDVIGREAELLELSDLWQEVQAGGSRAICLVGPPGIGKRTLFEAWLDRACLRPVRLDDGPCWTDGRRHACWVDLSTDVDVWDRLARRHAAGGWMIVASARGREWEAPFQRLPFRRLEVCPLDDGASRELLARSGRPVAPGSDGRLLELACGNPLALVELARSRDHAPGLELVSRLQHRTGRLAEECRTWLERFMLRVGPVPDAWLADPHLQSALRTLLEEGLMRLDADRLPEVLPFVSSALLRDMPSDRKQRVHAWLATFRSSEGGHEAFVAWHWIHAGRPLEALNWLDRLLGVPGPREVAWLATALEESTRGMRRMLERIEGLPERLARLALRTGSVSRARRWLARARPRTGSVRLLEAEIRMAEGNLSRASRLLRGTRSGELDAERGRKAIELACWLAIRQGHPAEAIARAHRRTGDDATGDLHGLCGIAHARIGEYAEAIAHHRAALLLRSRLGNRAGQVASLNNLGMVARERQCLEEARSWYERAANLSRRGADPRPGPGLLANLGDLAMRSGEFGLARIRLEAALEGFARSGDVIGVGSSWCALGELLRRQGCLDDAARNLHRGRQILEGMGCGEWKVETCMALGDLARDRGMPVVARRWWREGLVAARQTGRREQERTLRARMSSRRSRSGASGVTA